MTNVVFNRRNLLAAGGSVLATGVSGLLLPASAQSLAGFFFCLCQDIGLSGEYSDFEPNIQMSTTGHLRVAIPANRCP